MFKLFSTVKVEKGEVSKLKRPFILIDGIAHYYNQAPNKEQAEKVKTFILENMAWMDRVNHHFDRHAFSNAVGLNTKKFMFFVATLVNGKGEHIYSVDQNGAFTTILLSRPFAELVDAVISEFYTTDAPVSTATEPETVSSSLFDDEEDETPEANATPVEVTAEEPSEEPEAEPTEVTASLFGDDEDDAVVGDKIQDEIDYLQANPGTNISSRYNKTKEKDGLPALVDIAARLNIETKGLKESEITPLVREALGI